METSIFGQYARQDVNDLRTWEDFLNQAKDLKHIIELGTGNGAFSTWLLLQCIARNMTFDTFDHLQPKRFSRLANKLGLSKHFHKADILHNRCISLEQVLSVPDRLLLFCDNGNKPEEVRIYSPLLKREDLLAVHDWSTEIRIADIPTRFIPVIQYLTVGSITRFFIAR